MHPDRKWAYAVQSQRRKPNVGSLQTDKCILREGQTQSNQPSLEATPEIGTPSDDPGCGQLVAHTQLPRNHEPRDFRCPSNERENLSRHIHPNATSVWSTRLQQCRTCVRYAHHEFFWRRPQDSYQQSDGRGDMHRNTRFIRPLARVIGRHDPRWNQSRAGRQPSYLTNRSARRNTNAEDTNLKRKQGNRNSKWESERKK